MCCLMNCCLLLSEGPGGNQGGGPWDGWGGVWTGHGGRQAKGGWREGDRGVHGRVVNPVTHSPRRRTRRRTRGGGGGGAEFGCLRDNETARGLNEKRPSEICFMAWPSWRLSLSS